MDHPAAPPAALAHPLRGAGAWRFALPAALLAVALLLLAYRATAASMVETWSDSATFAHAFLVPPIVAWLVWRRRERLAALAPAPEPAWLPGFVVLGLAWLAARLALVDAAAQFALVAMLVLVVPALLGRAVARVLLFPLVFSFFAVPFGEFLMPLLMEGTADFTVRALRLLGVPVYREGLRFMIPTGSWSVVEACSGVRYLIASVMVGTLYAYLNYRSLRRRAIFVAVAFAVPIVANWVRALLIVLLGHLSDNRLAAGVDHLIYGWVFFGIVIGLLYWIGARWAEPAGPGPEPGAARAAGSASAPRIAAVALAVVVLGALAPLAARTLEGDGDVDGDARQPAPALVLPERLEGGWIAAAGRSPRLQPRAHEPSATAAGLYEGPGRRAVGVDLAYYRDQGRERKLVSSLNLLVASEDSRWNRIETIREDVAIGAGRPLEVAASRVVATDGGAPLVVWRLYWVDGRWVAGDVEAKLRGAWARLRGRGDDGAIVVLQADDDAHGAARAALHDFTAKNLAALDALLQGVRSAH